MNPIRIVIAIVLLLLAAGGAYYFLRPWFEKPVLPPAPARAQAPAAEAAKPRFPIPPADKPLPRLADSDLALREAILGLIDAASVQKFFLLEDVVRRVVATVDNLPRETVAARVNPVKPIGGLLATTGKDAELAIAPKNSARYTAFVRMVEGVDTGKLVASYIYFYPLFQQAYVELGYPNAYFNDRLVDVIDHLAATPEVKGPIRLVSPHVLYEYADPELEARSAGQKLLIRMGSENAARIKRKLAEVRSEVVARAKPEPKEGK